MKRKIEGYYDFENGDVLHVNGLPVATVNVNELGHIQLFCNDQYESKVYIGDENTPKAEVDDAINCFWSGMVIACNYSQKVYKAFLGIK